ncbi:MAG TPA: TetR/AcrR family transcriptional regulator [Actinoplanes sp.]
MTSVEGERRRRVPALAPDERRAALIAATIPLLREHGPDVSTRQIAQAAGVAEGTIFGVFSDKNTLLVTALTSALDPRLTLDAIAAIDPALDLRTRLIAAAALINQRFTGNAQLITAARKLALAHDADPEVRRRMSESRDALLAALTAMIEPDAGRLRRSPGATAGLLLLFCAGSTHGPFGDPADVNAAELVSLLLDGLLIRNDDNHGGAVRC